MQSFIITSALALMAGSAIAAPSAPNPATSRTYDIKGFTERKTNDDDITFVTFEIFGTNGDTTHVHCIPFDRDTKRQTDNWQDNVIYPCLESEAFYFAYSQESGVLRLFTSGAPTLSFHGTTHIADPYCHTAGQDQICQSPSDAYITLTQGK
ncbi:unnamed protein product [Zymoseptoria tritici ST99CH_1A5]|uniref:AA1-like domain-containing protein n=4 Tax=Zymoseptoria tritici TaxID=1047171 RepID=F9XKQ9_ZYMTI|nr:uncharacterized protein MYCGRDRAFT_111027 [Zymoseptoria tritici IPO323]SMQ54669.1 unnamed protein product [Zymoseptoria tritici ST99CH_3D7]SMR59109.1 unnamed protein product [Zymoseptoria tritici ST99CH_1E4]SMR62946.1 unnamed protein product [Zymoseptoria tritici ST99CH_3D1]SMY28317.1 unnamed protein product [Zymoseptoria tritici ST99CH_1A5]EGP84116.1 hypothetical protein MYCGRDRAFT_111027 [Zymoseptoria tritici IPO323]